jgi:hypothetical protein
MTVCAYCGRKGTRGFSLRHGDGRAPQTGDWCCSNVTACERRMERTKCGTCHPPADGSKDREVIDRFADFLREGWQPARRDGFVPRCTAAQMYRFHYQIWRIGAVDA